MPSGAADSIVNYRTCEFTILSRDGLPHTWPVCPRLLNDGRFLLTTSIGLPEKAFNIRRTESRRRKTARRAPSAFAASDGL
jgi:hypothetical protein